MSNIVTSGYLDSSVRPSSIANYNPSDRGDTPATYRFEGLSGTFLTWDTDILPWNLEPRLWIGLS